jgi:hypothetical protein
MIWVALGFLVLGVLVGGAGMKRLGRMAGRAWRPGAGMLALAAFLASAYFGVREAYAASLVLFLVGVSLSMSVRRISRRPHKADRSAPPPRRGGMSEEEARGILGVSADAGAEEIQAAYLRLIRRAHPDQGGTSGLAAQLNTARDVLLGKK